MKNNSAKKPNIWCHDGLWICQNRFAAGAGKTPQDAYRVWETYCIALMTNKYGYQTYWKVIL